MKLFKKTITLAELGKHHISHSAYFTDAEYLHVAHDLQKIIKKLNFMKMFGKGFNEDLAINLTLHLEDTVANAGLWRTFCWSIISSMASGCPSAGETTRCRLTK